MDENYYVSHGGKIPVKWTAPEVTSLCAYNIIYMPGFYLELSFWRGSGWLEEDFYYDLYSCIIVNHCQWLNIWGVAQSIGGEASLLSPPPMASR